MPKIFSYSNINQINNELQRDYYDRHSPVIYCDNEVKEGEPMLIKIRIGTDYAHPDEGDHYISLIQLWNRETLLVEARYYPGSMGNKAGNLEVIFSIIPKVSMRLTAFSYCTKHGLWQSEVKEVKVLKNNSDCK